GAGEEPVPARLGDVAGPRSRRDDQLETPRVIVPKVTPFGVASNVTPAQQTSRRVSPSRGTPRPVVGGMPTARDGEGRQLPRAYVARRRGPIRPQRVDLLNPASNGGGTRAPLSSA